jgi:hypothetical protein
VTPLLVVLCCTLKQNSDQAVSRESSSDNNCTAIFHLALAYVNTRYEANENQSDERRDSLNFRVRKPRGRLYLCCLLDPGLTKICLKDYHHQLLRTKLIETGAIKGSCYNLYYHVVLLRKRSQIGSATRCQKQEVRTELDSHQEAPNRDK